MFGKRARVSLIVALMLNMVLAGMALVPTVGAATVAVTPANMNGWAFAEETATGAGSIVTGPETPPLGVGSAELVVDATGREILFTTTPYLGVRLDSIEALAYSTYQHTGAPTETAISLQLNIDYDLTDGNTAWQGRLVYEPYQDSTNTVTTGEWQDWDALSATAQWWSSGAPGNTECPQANTCTWEDVLAAFPNAGIHATLGAINLRAGGPWAPGFTGNVDNFSITLAGQENVTYDFDPTPQVDLMLMATGGGSIEATPPGQTVTSTTLTYDQGTVVTLEPVADDGHTFAGWVVDGMDGGWDPTLTVTMSANRTVEAMFVETPSFNDVNPAREDYEAIIELTARGYIVGYGDGTFGPDKLVLRSEMAALIARAMPKSVADNAPNLITPPACLAANTWDCEVWNDINFSDLAGLDPHLVRDIRALAHYEVALGYGATACDDRDLAFPCFGPNDSVTYAQTITFITRAMIEKGYWVAQPNAPQPYSGVPADHDVDVRTYVHYVGSALDLPPGASWNDTATRGQFAQALWAALNTVFGDEAP